MTQPKLRLSRSKKSRQLHATTALSTALAQAQKQVAYADRVIDITGRSPVEPIYFDLEA